MCILFVYSAKQGAPAAAAMRIPFKLIVASNRDELLDRPTKNAGFWDNPDSNNLGGKDLQSGGTWLGINASTGKLGILLNIMGGTKPELTTSRGSIITNFLRSPKHLTGWNWVKNLTQDPSLDIFNSYSLFNFVAIDLLQDDSNIGTDGEKTRLNASRPQITYFTNHSTTARMRSPEPELITTNFFSLGNSILSKPFQKTIAGQRLFENIVRSTNDISRDELKTQLLQFLKSTDKHYPDPQMQEQGQEKDDIVLMGGSSIFVEPSYFNGAYGTRTHTIALVDNDNNLDFHEWTLKEPTDTDAQMPEWTDSHFNFQIPFQGTLNPTTPALAAANL